MILHLLDTEDERSAGTPRATRGKQCGIDMQLHHRAVHRAFAPLPVQLQVVDQPLTGGSAELGLQAMPLPSCFPWVER